MTAVRELYAIESKTIPDGRTLDIPLHRHRLMAELWWVESGEIEMTLCDQHRTISAGELVLISAGEWCSVHFPVDSEQRYRKLLFTPSPDSIKDAVFIANSANAAFLASLFDELAREMDLTSPVSLIKKQLLLDWLLAEVTETEALPLQPPKKNTMEHILHTMEETCHLPFSLTETAEHTGFSKFHFSRQFKETCGKTPLQFVISCRMDRAKHLLRTTEQPVPSIASLCGYKSATQFHAAFTHHTGRTPKRCRQQHQSVEAGR